VSTSALQPAPRPLFVPVDARDGDRRPRVRREQRQHFLVPGRELASALLVDDKEIADAHAAAIDPRAPRGAVGQHARPEPVPPEVCGHVPEAQRPPEAAPHARTAGGPFGPVLQVPLLGRRDAGADEAGQRRRPS